MNWHAIKCCISKYGTYFSIAAAVLTAGYQAYSGEAVPEWVYAIIGSLGLSVFRTTVSVNGAGDGWKTHAASVALAIGAGLQAAGIDVPDWSYAIAASAGLGSLRIAVKKI